MAWQSGINALLSLNGTAAAPTIRNWSIDPVANNVSGGSTDAGSGTFVLPGVKDFTGRFDYYNTSPIGFAKPGNTYTFYGQNPDGEYRGGIIITQTVINVDIEGGGIIGGSSTFASIGSSDDDVTTDNNALTYSDTPTSLTNSGVPQAHSSLGCKAQWALISGGSLGSYADMPSVRNWSLTLNNGATAFSAHDTGGVVKRIAGRNTASASVGVYQSDPDALSDAGLIAGSVGALRLFTAAASYWQVTYAVVGGNSADAQIESPAVMGASLNFAWSSHGQLTGGFTRGTIVDPAAVTWFS